MAGTVVLSATFEERLLGAVFGKRLDEFELAEMVERGFPARSVDFLRSEGLTFSEIFGTASLGRRSQPRKNPKQALSIEESDKILRLARIITLADQVFVDHQRAFQWLRSTNRRLEGRAPLEMLRSEAGGELVCQMLWQIDEGIYV